MAVRGRKLSVRNTTITQHLRDEGRPLATTDFFGVPVKALRYDEAFDLVRSWVALRTGRYVCFAAVATVIQAHDSPGFRVAVADADLVLPDGMPIVWFMRRTSHPRQERLCGPDLIFRLCADAARNRIPVGFYGSTPQTLALIRNRFAQRWPDLDIRYAYSPPFRPLTEAEESAILEDINASGIGLLFVGLGCPKQEDWMSRVRDRSRVVMFGIGGAFDVAAGTHPAPPRWVQKMGLQWAYRVRQEPRRLWRRYLYQNARFCWLVLKETMSRAVSSGRSRSRQS